MTALSTAGRAAPVKGLVVLQPTRPAPSLVELRILDHFVVAGDQVVSFAELGPL